MPTKTFDKLKCSHTGLAKLLCRIESKRLCTEPHAECSGNVSSFSNASESKGSHPQVNIPGSRAVQSGGSEFGCIASTQSNVVNPALTCLEWFQISPRLSFGIISRLSRHAFLISIAMLNRMEQRLDQIDAVPLEPGEIVEIRLPFLSVDARTTRIPRAKVAVLSRTLPTAPSLVTNKSQFLRIKEQVVEYFGRLCRLM